MDMSFFNKLKDVGNKVGSKFKEEAIKQRDKAKDRSEARNLLKKLKKKELHKYCREWDVEYDKKMTNEELIKEINYNSDLTLEKVENFYYGLYPSKRKALSITEQVEEDIEIEQEIIRTETIKTKVRKSTKTLTKLRSLLKNFSPITRKQGIKERDLEAQMVSSLRPVLGKDKVNYQERARGGRVDIVVDGKYAIELKVFTSPKQLTDMVGQVMNYSDEYEQVFVWIYDQQGTTKRKDINDFKGKMKKAKIKNVEVMVKK